jgi:hypothetical protein
MHRLCGLGKIESFDVVLYPPPCFHNPCAVGEQMCRGSECALDVLRKVIQLEPGSQQGVHGIGPHAQRHEKSEKSGSGIFRIGFLAASS